MPRETPIRTRAMTVGREWARRYFDKRKGHGRTRIVYAQIDEPKFAALVAAAYEQGYKAGMGKGGE